MTRRITQTFHGWDQVDVAVTLPAGDEHAGKHSGLLRAWAVVELTDEDGLVTNVVALPQRHT